jgi:NodT family efflux transporter outer membrane factor (OMF) lipoprotein
MSPRVRSLGAAAALFAAGCATQRESWQAREFDGIEVRERFASAEVEAAGDVAAGWITSFGDQQLDALVAEALAHNSDLELAAARAEFAGAQSRRASAELVPQVDVFADVGRGDNGLVQATRIDFGLAASWEPDVWGRLSSFERAAEYDEQSAQADYVAARQSLAAATARAWFLAIAAKQRVDVDERSLEQRERVERITRAHYEAGDQPRADLDVATGQTEGARQLAEQSRGALRSSLLALETLVGRYPSGALEAAAALPQPSDPPPLGLPSQLLERRPDVVAAERAVAAAYERVAGADAARLPRITLTAAGGFANDELKGLTDASNVIWNLGAGLLAPLFDGGRLRADADAARAQRRAALANYVGVARNAFLEVETALTAETSLRAREVLLAAAAEHLGRARERSEERYVEGEATLLDLDQLHTQFYLAERELVAARLDLALQRVALHLSLGGSFETQP